MTLEVVVIFQHKIHVCNLSVVKSTDRFYQVNVGRRDCLKTNKNKTEVMKCVKEKRIRMNIWLQEIELK